MPFTPVEFTRGGVTEVAYTREAYAQYVWDGWALAGDDVPPDEEGNAMPFTPVEFTNDTLVEVAYTPDQYAQYLWEGWRPTGNPTPAPFPTMETRIADAVAAKLAELGLDKLIISGTRPTNPPVGTVHIDNT